MGTVKERPILFSAPMVRAILAGKKTQTRRVMKPQPKVQVMQPGIPVLTIPMNRGSRSSWLLPNALDQPGCCPYGRAGDQLWVRETWTGTWCSERMHLAYSADGSERMLAIKEVPHGYCLPKAAAKPSSWVTPLFMPRWASRMALEIADVRVEQVQAISEQDAIAEGVEPFEMTAADLADLAISDESPGLKQFFEALGPGRSSAKHQYEMLWQEINGKRSGCSWADNPWVWVVEFKWVAA